MRIRQHAHLGDFAFQLRVGKRVHGDPRLLALLDLLDVALVDLDVHRHAGHVRDGDDGLAFADGGAFADGFLVAVIVVAGAAIDDQPAFLRADDAFFELRVEVLALAGLDFILALGRLQLGLRLRLLGDGHAPGLVQFAHRLGIVGKGFLGGLGKIIIQEQRPAGFRRLHFQFGAVLQQLVAHQLHFRDKLLGEQPLRAFKRGFGHAQILLRGLQIVFKLAQLLLGLAVPQHVNVGVFLEVNGAGPERVWRETGHHQIRVRIRVRRHRPGRGGNRERRRAVCSCRLGRGRWWRPDAGRGRHVGLGVPGGGLDGQQLRHRRRCDHRGLAGFFRAGGVGHVVRAGRRQDFIQAVILDDLVGDRVAQKLVKIHPRKPGLQLGGLDVALVLVQLDFIVLLRVNQAGDRLLILNLLLRDLLFQIG